MDLFAPVSGVAITVQKGGGACCRWSNALIFTAMRGMPLTSGSGGSQLLEDATLALAVVVAWLVVATLALELPFPVCPSLTGVRQTPL